MGVGVGGQEETEAARLSPFSLAFLDGELSWGTRLAHRESDSSKDTSESSSLKVLTLQRENSKDI